MSLRLIARVVALATACVALSAAAAKDGDAKADLFAPEAGFTAGHVLRNAGNGNFALPSKDARKLPPTRLGFVTPWNKDGYRRVVDYPKAFTHVSPCWFELQRNAAAAIAPNVQPFVVNGAGHVNSTWAMALADAGVVVLPRVLVDLQAVGGNLFTDAKASVAVASAIAKAVMGPGGKFARWASGVVIDWGGLPLSNAKLAPQEGVTRFLRDLRQRLSEAAGDVEAVTIVLVVPPDTKAVSKREYTWLAPLVEYFQLMTYDYNAGKAPKENAPMPWIDRIIDTIVVNKPKKLGDVATDAFPRSKLLIGVNLYGARFGRDTNRETINGKQFFKALREERELAKALNPNATKKELDAKPNVVWGTETKEHSLEMYVPKRGVEFIFFPSVASIMHRLHYAAVSGLGGVAAWEVGQGLEYFTAAFSP